MFPIMLTESILTEGGDDAGLLDYHSAEVPMTAGHWKWQRRQNPTRLPFLLSSTLNIAVLIIPFLAP